MVIKNINQIFVNISNKLFTSKTDRALKHFSEKVKVINALEDKFKALQDEDFPRLTAQYKTRVVQGEHLDDILPEAFALVREVSRRTIGLRHFDVQLIGGMALHNGFIAEMKTGEGKTLVATLSAYLNALTDNGVHLVTVNDYLVMRDLEWMGPVYRAAGLTAERIYSNMNQSDRKAAYNSDITYGTNSEFGFDYLRDNICIHKDEIVQKGFNYAIIDEIDSILIDEARTPLVISGDADYVGNDYYMKLDSIVKSMIPEHYEIDQKTSSVYLTESGQDYVDTNLKQAGLLQDEQDIFNLNSTSLLHGINQSLKANHMFKAGVRYMVHNNEVLIVDEFTGRVMEGRRFSDGLHQALEAKEGVPIKKESQTIASITYQNYFRNYRKLSGMTGTAATESNEFLEIYNLKVLSIPTNLPVKRIDEEDAVYRTESEKFQAIADEISKIHSTMQPILAGTISIEKSELLSNILKKMGIKHNVLNAKYQAEEAKIIAQAGRLGAVTIATNMAGRGTDIMLGGNPDMLIKADPNIVKSKTKVQVIYSSCAKEKEEILIKGGLFVIGTERHESRRIDNQLRGRSGRQGDPGRTKFYLSLEDDLMRIFGSGKVSGILQKLGLKEGEAIVHPWITRSLESAQKKVEAMNYDARKRLLQYDDILNQQRKVVYKIRNELIKAEVIDEIIAEYITSINEHYLNNIFENQEIKYEKELLIEEITKAMITAYGESIGRSACMTLLDLEVEAFERDAISILNKTLQEVYIEKIEKWPDAHLVVQYTIVQTLDKYWREYIHTLEHLRSGIHLRSYGQKDPLQEYKIEAFELFKSMLDGYKMMSLLYIMNMELHINDQQKPTAAPILNSPYPPTKAVHDVRISRNQQCDCGSGKKFKHCHGAVSANNITT